ncbi:MAG: response regulator receiver protein [Peptococcaceae bacterium]|jgi:YesN/AraC family two-component response regulator|nr:response regulator receiver protein [Peptococcaceae bacterium]
MKLLIVDDEKIEREALKFLFSRKRMDINIVGEASNGRQAIELNRTLKPDVVIMDIQMGIMDGLKATEVIKKENPFVEVILLTAYGRFDYSQQAIRCGVFDYLLKPIEESELYECLTKVQAHQDSKKALYGQISSYQLLDYWVKEKVRENSSLGSCEDTRIREVMLFIMEHLSEPLTLEYLAAQVHTSPSYLSRLFKTSTGRSLSNFILEARIEKAKFLLLEDMERPLKLIAKKVGFSTVQHFCNTFKKVTNTTPAYFRVKKGKYQ